MAALEAHPHLDERLHANPLFFTLLAALWLADTQRRLPATQAELYRAAVDLLLDRWARRRAPDRSVVENLGLTVAELRSVLESFACTIQESAQPGADTTLFSIGGLLGALYEAGYNPRVQDVATYLEHHAGLLVSPSRNQFYFSHRSFQEHLAACALTCREPVKRRPPVEVDRHFSAGLIQRVQSAPALWRNVAYLAADELMTRGHEGQTLLWAVLDEFCQPYLTEQRAREAVVIALGIAQHHDLFDLRKTDRRYRRDLEPLRQVAITGLTDKDNFTPAERNIAGQLLGRHPEHDTRKGVGRRPDGLPDINWVEIQRPMLKAGANLSIRRRNGAANQPFGWPVILLPTVSFKPFSMPTMAFITHSGGRGWPRQQRSALNQGNNILSSGTIPAKMSVGTTL